MSTTDYTSAIALMPAPASAALVPGGPAEGQTVAIYDGCAYWLDGDGLATCGIFSGSQNPDWEKNGSVDVDTVDDGPGLNAVLEILQRA